MRKLEFNQYQEQLESIFLEYHIDEKDRQTIKDIIQLEWDFFDKVKGLDGRSPCQDDQRMFIIMRLAQHLLFSPETRESILRDYQLCLENTINPVEGKYARMMAYTDQERYKTFLDSLPDISPIKSQIILDIIRMFQEELNELSEKLPETTAHSRPVENQGKEISSLSYFYAELTFFSYGTLRRMKHDITNLKKIGCIETIYRNTIKLHKILP